MPTYHFRSQLRNGQYAIAWLHFIRKVNMQYALMYTGISINNTTLNILDISCIRWFESIIRPGKYFVFDIDKNIISLKISGFPLEKAIEYTKLRKPYIINNLEMQYDIQDRRSVYRILEKEGIELPRHSVFDRTSNNPSGMSSCELIWAQTTISYFEMSTN